MPLPEDARLGLPRLQALLDAPGAIDVAALEALRQDLPDTPTPEAWNTAFDEGSLFDAWTRTALVQGLYAANAASLRALIDARQDPVILEVGGGDGRLWDRVLREDDRATLVLVDPHDGPHERLAARLPGGVRLVSVRRGIESARLPEADAIVCSLTLHHLAGVDGAQRATVGLGGPGKREVLARFARVLTPRCGLLLLNEADVDCEVDLRPGDATLKANLADSYVRRCAAALMRAIPEAPTDDLAARWWTIIRRWCLDQLDMADVPVAERDVYELTVPRWLALLRAAGFAVLDHRFTDDIGLFHRYACVPAQAWRAASRSAPGISP